MSSYLRNWFSSGGASANNNLPTVVPSIPEIISVSPPPSEHDSGDEDDQPPAFPALSSIQRSGGNSTSRSPVTLPNRSPDFDSKMMPPPSLPIGLNRNISSSNSLSLPTSTTKPMPKVNTKGKARQNVALTPGHGPLDWAKLKTSGVDLRDGVTALLRVTPSELKQHRKRDDAWSAFNGKVYNITHYLEYHPGGEKELMRVAGRDGTSLFASTHSWVNLDFMLDGCMIGFLVPETS